MNTKVEKLVKIMSDISGYSQEDILGHSRRQPLCYIRYCIFYFLGYKLKWSRAAIGREFDMDHSSVTHGVKKIVEILNVRVTYDNFIRIYEEFENAVSDIMDTKKIYISLPITGRDENERRYFANGIISMLAERMPEYEVVNPLDNKLEYSVHWSKHMAEDIKMLLECDAIFMCRDWQWSHGCKLEHDIATSCGLDVYYQDDKWICPVEK